MHGGIPTSLGDHSLEAAFEGGCGGFPGDVHLPGDDCADDQGDGWVLE